MEVQNKRRVLRLGIANDDIVTRADQNRICDFSLCRKRFAGTGRTEDQAVGVFQQLPIYHNQVVGHGIQAVVQGFTARLK